MTITDTRLDRRPRGVTGYTLDTGLLKDGIIDAIWKAGFYKDSTRDDLFNRIEPMSTVVCYAKSGEWALINSEGVGRYADSDGKSAVHFWIDTYHSMDVELDYETVDGCMTGGNVELAEFIRVFGDRLDSNHHLWFRWATK